MTLAERVEFIFALWMKRHVRGQETTPVVPVERLERGRDRARELALDPGETVLLHGDLHPGNVLDGGAARGLIAIDPRPCVGDAAVDVVDWVFWMAEDPEVWRSRCRELVAALAWSGNACGAGAVPSRRCWTSAPLLAAAARTASRPCSRLLLDALRPHQPTLKPALPDLRHAVLHNVRGPFPLGIALRQVGRISA